MALKVTKVNVWAGDLRDVPGGLADVLGQLAAGGGSIQFLIARRSDKSPGAGKVFVTPIDKPRLKDAAGRAGLQNAANMATLRLEGTDRPGLGSKITRAMADAGINVRGVSAAVIGGKFVAYIGLDSDDDADSVMRALKGVNGAARKRSAGPKKPAAKKPTRGRAKSRR
jgi:predicted amino acid-binding ACT domain protein